VSVPRPIALDATYSLGADLSGVGVYCREVLYGLSQSHPSQQFIACYRSQRFVRSLQESLPANCRRRLLSEATLPRRASLFHGMNQRLPRARMRRRCTTFHDLFVMTGDYSTPEFRRRFTAQAAHAAELADLIVCVSGFTATQVEQLLRVEPSRLRVIHHGIGFRLSASSIPREPMVLHIGAIQKRKNISRLVRAFERVLPDPWRLVLAGSSGHGSGEIVAQVEASSARSRIELPGYVPPDTIRRLYATASIFAFPSLDEGFGMPVLDAMACGVPVLTSNRSALPEVCGDAALLVDPFSDEQIADGLATLATDQTLRDGLIARGRSRADEFSWEKAVEQTWKVYAELLD
jgi:glycosyltransferase involved in cell wall biosynthesis